jgi:hypothetical protein
MSAVGRPVRGVGGVFREQRSDGSVAADHICEVVIRRWIESGEHDPAVGRGRACGGWRHEDDEQRDKRKQQSDPLHGASVSGDALVRASAHHSHASTARFSGG